MKTLFISLLLICVASLSLPAQSVKVTYLVNPDASLKPAPSQAHLIVNRQESLFYNQGSDEAYYSSEEKDGYGLPQDFEMSFPSKKDYLHKDLSGASVTDMSDDFKGEYFTVKDTLHPMEWTIGKDQKEIMGYICLRATTHFRGRDYRVWFAPDLPFSNGPWKLGGLPGLILEAREGEGMLEYIASEITLLKEEVTIKLPEFTGESISPQAFLDRYLNQLEEYYAFKEAQLRKEGSSIKITIDRSKFQPLEIYGEEGLASE